jgi:hypothetical protein
MKLSPLGHGAKGKCAQEENARNQNKCRIFNVLLHRNSSPNMFNENKRTRIMGGMKLGALGENAK